MPISACQHRITTGCSHNYRHSGRKKYISPPTSIREFSTPSLCFSSSLLYAENGCYVSSLFPFKKTNDKKNITRMLMFLLLLSRIHDGDALSKNNDLDNGMSARVIPSSNHVNVIDNVNLLRDITAFPVYDNLGSRVHDLSSDNERISDDIYKINDQGFNKAFLQQLIGNSLIDGANSENINPTVFIIPLQKTDLRLKRMAINERENNLNSGDYFFDNCYIRTKNNQGTVLGDSLLLSGEYLRNPIHAAAELIYKKGMGGGEMPESLAHFTEATNVLYDVVLSIMTSAAYPIVKYGAAKVLKVSSHVINGDNKCLVNELSPRELANLLLDTETGITHRRAFVDFPVHPKPSELQSIRRFVPDGVFVHENVKTGLNTIKYMKVIHQQTEYIIGEKRPGEYYTLHAGATKPEFVEKRVYFDNVNNKIHFRKEMPMEQGLDYEIVDGKKFIHIYGEDYELLYNWDMKTPEIILSKTNGDKLTVPVYIEPHV